MQRPGDAVLASPARTAHRWLPQAKFTVRPDCRHHQLMHALIGSPLHLRLLAAGRTRPSRISGFSGYLRLCFRHVLGLVVLLICLAPASGQTLLIDGFDYATSAAAAQAWGSGTSAPPVTMADSGEWGDERVMTLPCDFATRPTRCYWTRNVAIQLSSFTDFALEIFAPDPAAVANFTLYFRSGAGWYRVRVPLAQAGWQTLRFSITDFATEGTPAGWDQIDGIRLSPWKAASRNTTLAVRSLRAFTPQILIVSDELSSNPTIVEETIDRHRAWLGRYRVDCGVISTAGVEAGRLAGCQLAILPYNENLSTAAWTQLEAFVAAGGKVLAYYLLPPRLEALLGIQRTGWAQGDFASWAFNDSTISGLPDRVDQDSWNITLAVPSGTLNSRTIATWNDSNGSSTGRAAWLASDHGLFFSHVLLGDDADTKAYAIFCLVAHYLPGLLPDAAAGSIESIGQVGPYGTFAEATTAIDRQAQTTLRALSVASELAAATSIRDQAIAAQSAGHYLDAINTARSARDHLRRAYQLSLRPAAPEFRAFWDHQATGPFPGDWPAAIDALAANGFTAIFPNCLWGGLAHYDSALLPHSAVFATYGDQITACVSAAHARGIQVHVWKVDWNLGGAPQSFIDSLRAAGRTQVSRDGQPLDWLCPSHPENLALETDSLLEVVRNYDVDGIHFDYIRYPNSSACYCAGCGSRFQAQTGRTVANWPADVLAAGALRTAFLDWRRAQITRLVAAVHNAAKALKPDIQISAAVFPDAASAYDEVGQDWHRWIDEGLVDFLCPMDYTTDLNRFTELVDQQLAYAAGRIPIYPGIGAESIAADGVLAQIEATRARATGGFVLFELGPSSVSQLLPALHAGATAPDEPDTDRDSLPDAWEQQRWGNLSTAGATTDSDADGTRDCDEYVFGTDPSRATALPILTVTTTGPTVIVSFTARAVESLGYQNAARHYRLETTSDLAAATAWAPVPGFEDRTIETGTQLLTFSTASGPERSRWFRLRAWLQQR